MKQMHVYMVANRSRTLYVGVTNDLARWVWEHKHMQTAGFTRRYLIDRLVYYEAAPDAASAILREKQIKGWVRRRKVGLIESTNPEWRDLSDDFLDIRTTVLFKNLPGHRQRGRRDSSPLKASAKNGATPESHSHDASPRGAQNDAGASS